MDVSRLCKPWLTAVAAAAALVLACAQAGAADNPWQKGAGWVSIRAGYAKSLAKGAPNGMGGYGFGYSRMVTDRVSVGVFIHHELLGMFGRAAQIEIPTTLEYAWHFPMKTAMRPYIGAGVGAFYHKVYRSVDRSHFDSATIFKLGADTPLDRRSLLGVDLRFAS